MLGGISRVSLWRMEKRGLITPSKLLRTKLYSRADLERLLETSK
jgi:DNA-binding transcriptional MerR regulator